MENTVEWSVYVPETASGEFRQCCTRFALKNEGKNKGRRREEPRDDERSRKRGYDVACGQFCEGTQTTIRIAEFFMIVGTYFLFTGVLFSSLNPPSTHSILSSFGICGNQIISTRKLSVGGKLMTSTLSSGR